MRVFARLRALADFQRRELPLLRTPEEHELVREIGHHQVLGAPLTPKQIVALGIGSQATAERRLARLKRLGMVRGRRSPSDGRVVELTLTPACMKAFSRLESFLAEGGGLAERHRPMRHACSLCAGDAEGLEAILRFLREGWRRGHVCAFLASDSSTRAIESALRRSARARGHVPGHLLVCNGAPHLATVVDFLREAARRAEARGKRLYLATQMAWTRRYRLGLDDILDIEAEIGRIVARCDAHVLCQYDMRVFAGPPLQHILRAHPESVHLPFDPPAPHAA